MAIVNIAIGTTIVNMVVVLVLSRSTQFPVSLFSHEIKHFFVVLIDARPACLHTSFMQQYYVFVLHVLAVFRK